MKIRVDTHMHTLMSGHAYNSPLEMIKAASEIEDLEMIALTDHGPTLPGAPHAIYFSNLKDIPYEMFGIKILKGVEANIIDENGNIDMPDFIMDKLQFRMAGFHFPMYGFCTNVERNTNAMIGAIKNPFIDAISHPGNVKYPIDIESVVRACKENNKALEINNHSFTARAGSEENCINIAKKCKEHGVFVVCGSDAHFHLNIAKFDSVYNILAQADFPEELVLNTSAKKIESFLISRGVSF